MTPQAILLLQECERTIKIMDECSLFDGTIDDIFLLGLDFTSRVDSGKILNPDFAKVIKEIRADNIIMNG